MLDAGTPLVGRVTDERFAGTWPDQVGEFADKMDTMPKVVVSTTVKLSSWSSADTVSFPGGVRVDSFQGLTVASSRMQAATGRASPA